MIKSKFKIGDIVQLNTGGPKMTVESYRQLDKVNGQPIVVYCVWFDIKHNIQDREFEEDTLVKI